MNAQHWHVTENTPGYLPDSDDTTLFEDEASAIAYADELADELAEHIFEGTGAEPDQSGKGTGFVMTYDSSRIHDLGRVIHVDMCTEDCEAPE